ncbi:hypothetical protein Nepgr_012372 [Nepenthes gracilis]|uniref:Uncharacterized protein n=1 Tax=Nepenthes gracilis TaxID=150966 RepID=A0AAD3XN92_NEPGR|nr:hypothetical protein Nepgr_012372 [Nepenthes gracilis]
MDEHSTSTGDDSGASGSNGLLDTSKADRAVWLMKCPDIVSRFLQSSEDDSGRVAKVVLSVDPLRPDDSPEFTMELASSELGNVPKRYVMDMSKDFIPMSVFSESDQGTKVNDPWVGPLDAEAVVQLLPTYLLEELDLQSSYSSSGMVAMELPACLLKMIGSARIIRFEQQFLKEILKDICVYVTKGANQGTYVLKPEYQASGEEPSSSSSQEVDSPFFGDS